MTDEEQAMTQFKNTFCITCEDKEICDISILNCTAYDSIYKQAFLAGLKEGKDMAEADLATIAYMQGAERYKTKWHKVADCDYPPCEKDNYSIKVLTDCGNIVYYNYDEECWVAEPISAEIDPPIAWCEIPKYKE